MTIDLRGFAPLGGPGATRLILGSMPGTASLQAAEYYAHPRNAFWMIAESLWNVPREAPYPVRVLALESAGIAVWDVLASCRRSGSLDSAIERDSIVVNDFGGFLRRHRQITGIYFNGNLARQLFDRHVLESLPASQQAIPEFTLPSTSPANARLSLPEKTRAWRQIMLAGE